MRFSLLLNDTNINCLWFFWTINNEQKNICVINCFLKPLFQQLIILALKDVKKGLKNNLLRFF
jgi:hypothetical protein